MDWRDVSGQFLKRPSALDNLFIHPYGEPTPTRMPALVKVTLGLLEQAMKSGHNRLIVVYPDKQQLTFMTVIFQAVNDVISGTLATKYDIFSFQKGQRLKVLNLVCEFDRIETDPKDHIKRIFVRFSDSLCGYPIEKAPFFQLTDTNRPLSKTPSFKEIMRKTTYDSVVDQLADYKTYMPDTVYYISSIGNAKNLMTESLIDGEQISEVILLGQTTREGEIHTIGKGQLTGIPAVTLATDLYSVNVSAKNGTPARIIFIDGTNENLIDTQLDAIDPLLYNNIPVICLTDSAHSFDMKSLEDRDFLSLRWDEDSIVPDLYRGQQTTVLRKISNCANRKIEYILCNNQEITEIHKLLNKFRACQQDYSAIMQEAFWQIFRIAFYVLRNTLQLPDEILERYRQEIDRLESVVETQDRFLAPEEIIGYGQIFNNLREICTEQYIFAKATALEEKVFFADDRPVCIIIPDDSVKSQHERYWDQYCKKSGIVRNIRIVYPLEFCNSYEVFDEIVIVSGWLGKKTMQKILYSNLSASYTVLLSVFENRWKRSHQAQWQSVLKNDSKRRFSVDILKIPLPPISKEADEEDIEVSDQLDIIEHNMREYKYRKYDTSSGTTEATISVEAIPVNFIGGYFAFYRLSRRLITATGIISGETETIKEKLPHDLEPGDFVVVREAEKNIIRELADEMLIADGNANMRSLSGRWKEPLETKRLSHTIQELYQQLAKEGCTIGYQAFRNWVEDDDRIGPRNKDDILFIAAALGDNYLIENIDKVYEACRVVRNAHQDAGKILSKRLKSQIADTIGNFDTIDPMNIWDPIVLQLEDIGTVRILKVTEIGSPVTVDAINTNRLLTE